MGVGVAGQGSFVVQDCSCTVHPPHPPVLWVLHLHFNQPQVRNKGRGFPRKFQKAKLNLTYTGSCVHNVYVVLVVGGSLRRVCSVCEGVLGRVHTPPLSTRGAGASRG